MSSAIPIRSDLAALPAYVPGRSVPGAIKLASNEVPGEPHPNVTHAVTQAMSQASRYPDTGAWELVDRLATTCDVPADRVAVGCGSVSLCQQFVQALCEPGDEVVFGWRSFEAYPIVTQVGNATPVPVPLDSAHTHDLDAMLAAISTRTRLVFVCNPNNPTGTAVRREELVRFLDQVPSDVLVVLDEAYREFVTDGAVPDGMEFLQRPNVAVLRTFSKAYGLAGLRVGYAVGPEEVIAAVRKVCVAFSVNSLAQAAAVAALDVRDTLLDRCADVARMRSPVRDALLEMGYTVPETQANFVWLPLGERTEAFTDHALQHKVVVRPFAGEGVRVTIGRDEENEAFLHAAAEFPG